MCLKVPLNQECTRFFQTPLVGWIHYSQWIIEIVLTVSLFRLLFLSTRVTPVVSSMALKECRFCKNTRTTTERCRESELIFVSGSDKQIDFTLRFMSCYGWCFLDWKPLCNSDRTFSYIPQRDPAGTVQRNCGQSQFICRKWGPADGQQLNASPIVDGLVRKPR